MFLYVFVQDVLNWLVRCQKWIRIQEVSFEETKGKDGKLEIQKVYLGDYWLLLTVENMWKRNRRAELLASSLTRPAFCKR